MACPAGRCFLKKFSGRRSAFWAGHWFRNTGRAGNGPRDCQSATRARPAFVHRPGATVMRAGAYRVPVVLQRPIETRLASGEITANYEAAGSVFAALRLKSQSERFADSRTASSKTWEIRLRPFSGLAGGWRILSGTRVFPGFVGLRSNRPEDGNFCVRQRRKPHEPFWRSNGAPGRVVFPAQS
ncbi:head-tail adaptor protein [Roseibium alexandrii]|uniref:head-tail adaptor protein n=1 Tax=Roseibium alexandrii TaxID=388408 RepID=UPI003750F0DC